MKRHTSLFKNSCSLCFSMSRETLKVLQTLSLPAPLFPLTQTLSWTKPVRMLAKACVPSKLDNYLAEISPVAHLGCWRQTLRREKLVSCSQVVPPECTPGLSGTCPLRKGQMYAQSGALPYSTRRIYPSVDRDSAMSRGRSSYTLCRHSSCSLSRHVLNCSCLQLRPRPTD